LGVWRPVQDYDTSPRVLGHELEIHPLMTRFAVMVGWQVGGIAGIYLLLPLAAAIRAIWRRSVTASSHTQRAPVLVHEEILRRSQNTLQHVPMDFSPEDYAERLSESSK